MFTSTNTASIGIAFFLLSSHLGMMLPEFFPLPSFTGYALFAMGAAPLWWNRLNSNLTALSSPRLRLLKLYFLLVFFIAVISSTAAFQYYGINSIFKTSGLIIVFSTLISCAGYYSSKDLRNGLILYSVIELSLLYFTKSEWNANAVASRAATAAITSYFLMPYFIFGFSLFAIGLIIAFRFQARTVLLSMIFAYTAVYFSRQMQKNTAAVSIVLIVVFLAVASFSHEGLSALRKYAKSSMNSQNELAQFFLSDKNENDIDGDFFDRQLAWTNGLNRVKEHPFLGIGVGNETKAGGLSSHNSYLSLAVEGGLFSLVLWLLIYFEVGRCLFSLNTNINPVYLQQLKSLAIFLFVYLLLSGILEKSGLGSILSPNNIICIFIAFWIMQQNPLNYSEYSHQANYIIS